MMKDQHKHAPWRKMVLVPFWTIQLLLELVMIGLMGLALGVLVNWDRDFENSVDTSLEVGSLVTSSTETEAKIVVPVWIAMLLLCLILTITEIILLARHRLKPKTFVIMNTIKTFIFTIIFALDVKSAVDNHARTASVIGVIIEAILYLSFVIPLIYGSIIYHRDRSSSRYTPVQDPLSHPTEYPSQYKTFVADPHADMERGLPGARRLSYNHARDTRFEAFQQRRSVSYGDREQSTGDIGLGGERGVGAYEMDRKAAVGSPKIPTLVVEHHDGTVYHDGEVYEMESRKSLR